jgi:hypothetical protein
MTIFSRKSYSSDLTDETMANHRTTHPNKNRQRTKPKSWHPRNHQRHLLFATNRMSVAKFTSRLSATRYRFLPLQQMEKERSMETNTCNTSSKSSSCRKSRSNAFCRYCWQSKHQNNRDRWRTLLCFCVVLFLPKTPKLSPIEAIYKMPEFQTQQFQNSLWEST